MKCFLKVILFSSIAIIGTNSHAKTITTEPPLLLHLASEDENSSITAECHGKQPLNIITCSFSKIEVSKSDEPNYAKKMQKALDDIKTYSPEQKTNGLNQFKEICTELKNANKKRPYATTEKKNLINLAKERIKASCDTCKTLECFASNTELNLESETCRISNEIFIREFKKVSVRKWESSVTGLCIDFHYTIEQSDDSGLGHYVYTSEGIRNERTSLDSCKQFKSGVDYDKKIIYSWENPTETAFSCKVIKL